MSQSTNELIQHFTDSLLGRLSQIFGVYGGSSINFDTLVATLRDDPKLDPQQLHDGLQSEESAEALSLDALFEVAAAFALRAQRHLMNQDHTHAWIDVSSSQYWVGVIAGSQLAIGAGQLAFSKRGRTGAEARTAKYQCLKDRVRELAEAGNFPSKRRAALSMEKEIVNLARSRGLSLSPDQAERTITKWLTEMGLFRRAKK